MPWKNFTKPLPRWRSCRMAKTLELLEMVEKKPLGRAVNEDKEKPERKPTWRKWAKWAGYDCGE